jgi:hypothetical protein
VAAANFASAGRRSSSVTPYSSPCFEIQSSTEAIWSFVACVVFFSVFASSAADFWSSTAASAMSYMALPATTAAVPKPRIAALPTRFSLSPSEVVDLPAEDVAEIRDFASPMNWMVTWRPATRSPQFGAAA